MNRSPRPVTGAALAALASLSLFPLIVVALNVVQRRSYHPTEQAISELALGRGGGLMVLAFCGVGAGVLLVAVIIHRTSEKAKAAPWLLGVASIGAGPLSAAFHTDLTGARTTLHGTVHNLAGLASFLLILAAMVVSAYRFRREPLWRDHARPTTVLAVVAVVAFFAIPVAGTSHFGLAQRFFVGTFIVWLIATAAHARHLSVGGVRASEDDSAGAVSGQPVTS